MRRLIVMAFVCLVSADFNNDSYEAVKNSRNFTGKVVLVTGSSSGIGEATAKLFSILGAKVVVTGRNATKIKRVAENVHNLSPYGLRPLQVVADLTKSDDVKRLVDSTIKKYGKIDVLVNNAGQSRLNSIRSNQVLSDFDHILDINVRSIMELIHLTVPYLEKSKGTIINVSSVLGIQASKGFINYQMAKASVDMMTKVLALELSPRIRVNAINPGPVNTPLVEVFPKNVGEKIISSTPMKRFGEPLDIAKGIVFLASTDAQFITGTNLIVDGGIILNPPDLSSV